MSDFLRTEGLGLYVLLRPDGWACWLAVDPAGPLKLLTGKEPGVDSSAMVSDRLPNLGYSEALDLAVKNLRIWNEMHSILQSMGYDDATEEGIKIVDWQDDRGEPSIVLDKEWAQSITPERAVSLQERLVQRGKKLSKAAQENLEFVVHLAQPAATEHYETAWSSWLTDQEKIPEDISALKHYKAELPSLADALKFGESVLPVVPRVPTMDF